MALKKTITRSAFGQSVSVPDAYIRVESISGTKSMIHADIAIATADGQRVDFLKIGFQPNMDGGNFIKQAYEHLKTLPDFAGAVDC
jgi:hypothetical protein